MLSTKQGGLQDHEAARFFQQEHLVRQGVPGLVGVELHGAEVINVHLALAQLDGGKIVLVHRKYLQKSGVWDVLPPTCPS